MKTQKFKNLLKKLSAGIVVLAIALVLFAACDKTGQTTTPSENPDPKPPVEVVEVKVTDILAEMETYQNLDINGAYENLAQSIAAEKLAHSEVMGFVLKNDVLNIVGKTKNGGNLNSVSVQLPASATQYVSVSQEMLKGVILQKAGYTASSQVDEKNKTEAQNKLNSAINGVLAEIAAGKSGQTLAKNDYVVAGTNINLADVFVDSYVKAFVREDGTVLAYESVDAVLKEHHYIFTGKNLTPAQMANIIKNGTNGVDYTETVKTINVAQTYTPPELQQPEIETVTFDELYAQVFGDNYTLPTFGDLMQEILPNIMAGSDLKALFTGFDGDDFYLFAEGAGSSGNKGFRKCLYKGADLSSILKYRDDILPLLSQENLKEILKSLYLQEDNIEKDSPAHATILNNLMDFKTECENSISVIRSVQRTDFKNTNIFTSTTEISEYKPYAEKLFPEKEIIYAGVSDLGGRAIDESHFNTGYYDSFNILSVYTDGDNIIIDTRKIYVPYYNGSTVIDRYNEYLVNGNYDLGNGETITITDPVEVQRLQEFASKAQRMAQYQITGLENFAEEDRKKRDN